MFEEGERERKIQNIERCKRELFERVKVHVKMRASNEILRKKLELALYNPTSKLLIKKEAVQEIIEISSSEEKSEKPICKHDN